MSAPGLIVNADDFGLSTSINRGIIQGHCNGIVTSTSLAAVGEAFAEAVGLLQTHPDLDAGLHLTLTSEKPLLPPASIPTLVDKSNRFPGHTLAFSKQLLSGQIRRAEIRKELEAQIQRALDHRVALSHLDSHQHVHLLPGVFGIVLELAKKYRIPALRLPREPVPFSDFLHAKQTGRAIMQGILWLLCQRPGRSQIRVPDHFRGFSVGGALTQKALRTLLLTLPKSGITELMCHPGLGETTSPYSGWGYQHVAELEALCAPEIRSILEKQGVQLLSFRDLSPAGQA